MEVNLGAIHPEEESGEKMVRTENGGDLDTVESLCCNDVWEEEREHTVV